MPSTMRIITSEDIYVQVYFYSSRLVNSHHNLVQILICFLEESLQHGKLIYIKYDH